MSDLEVSDIDEQEQVEQPKKGRGRPKKTTTKAKPQEKSSDEPPAKRGRGRPPGTKKAATASTKSKKTDDAAGNEDGEEAVKAPPKRRGRPAKAAPKEKEPESEPEEQSEDEDSFEDEPEPPKAKAGKVAGKKAAKNGHASESEKSEDDGEEDAKSEKSNAASSDSRIKIVVEHCKSCHTYRKKAEEIIDALKEKWSNIEVEYNPSKPRKGAFEFKLINSDGSDVKLYSGVELGPPRKLKFPDPDVVVEAMEKAYVPESA